MTWEPPSYIEVNMSSEIGAYQDDFDERTAVPPAIGSHDAALPQAGQPSGSGA